MEHLASRREAFATLSGAKSSVNAVITEMAYLYAQRVSLPASHPTYSSYHSGLRNSQASSILVTLDTCTRLGGESALSVVLQRVLALKMNPEYINNTLVPLLPGICGLARREGKSVTSEPFASGIRIIMNNWVEVVLGPKPNEAAGQPLLVKLQKFTCTEPNCVRVRKFLTTVNAENSMTLARIGAPARKHIERELQVHACSAATFETVRTTPQGLTVRWFCANYGFVSGSHTEAVL